MGGLLLKMFGGNIVTMWIVGIVIAVVLGYIAVLKYEINSITADKAILQVAVAEKNVEIERQKGQVLTCNGKIEVTNNRISDLKTQNDFRNKTLEMLSDNIELFREQSSGRIAEVADASISDGCDAAMEFLRKGIGEK